VGVSPVLVPPKFEMSVDIEPGSLLRVVEQRQQAGVSRRGVHLPPLLDTGFDLYPIIRRSLSKRS
jgi:hypothetical protein